MDWVSFSKRRAGVLGLAALAGFTAHWCSPAPPPPTLAGLAASLGAAARVEVDPDGIFWEPSHSWPLELALGRRVLFLGRDKPGAPRELYRARVRVTMAGQPISVSQVRNVTQTPLGDDAGLTGQGNTAVFATVAFDKIQGVSVLDLDGVRAGDRPSNGLGRLLDSISSYLATGSFAGLGRTDVVLDVPAKSSKLELKPPLLHIDLGEAGRSLVYDIGTRTLHSADGGEPYAARAVAHLHPPKPFLLWAVDTVRSETGVGPIAWLEDKVFGAKDVFKRASYAMFGHKEELRADASQITAHVNAPKIDSSGLTDDGQWPPSPIQSLWKTPVAGEGEWTAVDLPFLKPPLGAGAGSKAQPYFYRTAIRPDPKRPYSEVLLIAMDMRQLEIGMQAGFEDPSPLVGPPGEGRLPRDPKLEERVVATFNGAFKTEHGAYGMMVDHRVLLPPVPGGASIVVNSAGDAGLGNWPQTREIPSDLVSFRQNLDPLVEDGKSNPTGRSMWGWQIEGTSVMTQRTAICLTPAGHLYYAFAHEADGPTLARALTQAGCSYAIHLDMNPGHCGFVFNDIVPGKKQTLRAQVADPDMRIASTKFVNWSAKDFFYVMLRDPVPHDGSGIEWQPDGGTQPPPAQLAGVFTSKIAIGSATVELTSFEQGRVSWWVTPGTKELGHAGVEMAGDSARRVIAGIGLGHTTDSLRYGLAYGSNVPLPLRSAYATVVITPGHDLAVAAPGETPTVSGDQIAVQLPLLADDGRLLDSTHGSGQMRERGALCVAPSGRVLIAHLRHDSSDLLAEALLRTGCTRVVELDRGSHHPAFVHRAGTPTPPLASYDATVLYAIGIPMRPHAFRWKLANSQPASKPTVPVYYKRPEHAKSTEPDGSGQPDATEQPGGASSEQAIADHDSAPATRRHTHRHEHRDAITPDKP